MKLKKVKQTIISILIIFSITISSVAYATDTDVENNTNDIDNTTSEETQEALEDEETLDIKSESVILIDASTGAVIYSKNSDKEMYPASTTKIMTAILVLENGNLDDIVTVSQTAIASIPAGYSSSYLSEGEEMSVSNLLKALLLHSSNDVANVLAEYISGSIEEFVNLMNQKATELGCTNTNFVNTNGIFDENHYSTASDLAIIAKYCMQNSTFRTLVSMTECTIPATNKFEEERKYINSNNLLISTSEYYREDCIGIKTGYTYDAKYCLISAGSQDDMEVISVILHANSAADRYSDAIALLDYGYEYLEQEKIRIAEEEKAEAEAEAIATQLVESESIWNYIEQNNFLILTVIAILILIILLFIIIKPEKKRRNKRKH